MFISKKISSLIVVLALLAGSSGLNAVSAQDKKKAAERKLKRTTKEATKGKAKAVVSVKQPLVVKRTIATQQPVATKQQPVAAKKPVAVAKKQPVAAKQPAAVRKTVAAKKPVAKGYQTMSPVDITTLPAPMDAPIDITTLPAPMDAPIDIRTLPAPMNAPVDIDMPIPTYMPPVFTLRVGLVSMLPSNLKNRVENIITSNSANSQNMFKNIYLLAWVDDELMKKFNSSDFYSTLLTVISQECNVPYAVIETMAAPVKDQIDSTLTNFENAIIAGDASKFDVQQVRSLFRGQEDSYGEYLERCLRIANEYKQSNMVLPLKIAITTAAMPYTEEDF